MSKELKMTNKTNMTITKKLYQELTNHINQMRSSWKEHSPYLGS